MLSNRIIAALRLSLGLAEVEIASVTYFFFWFVIGLGNRLIARGFEILSD